MDIQEITKLIEAVSEHGLTSFELEEGNMRICLKREGGQFQAVMPALAEAASGHAQESEEGTEPDAGQVVSSPLVGIFYAAASPEEEAYVKVGDRVKKGQVLGLIEAMKLMNEVECEYDGVVEAILVGNEDMVEYGQPLFRIQP